MITNLSDSLRRLSPLTRPGTTVVSKAPLTIKVPDRDQVEPCMCPGSIETLSGMSPRSWEPPGAVDLVAHEQDHRCLASRMSGHTHRPLADGPGSRHDRARRG